MCAGNGFLGELAQGAQLGAQVGVVQKGLFRVADIDKGGIQAGDQFADPAEKDVANRKIIVGLLVMELHEPTIFQYRNLHDGWRGVDNQFFFHHVIR